MSSDTFYTIPLSPLRTGTYLIIDNTEAVDGSSGSTVVSNPTVASVNQQWIWDGQLWNSGGFPGRYLTDAGGGPVIESITPPFDNWFIIPAPLGTFYIQNRRTGNYLTNVGGTLTMAGSTQYAWNLISPIPARPVAVNLTNQSVTINYLAPIGTVLSPVSVVMSDASAFAGTLTSSDPTNFFAISGSNPVQNLVTGRALTAADIGTHSTTITASQNGFLLPLDIEITL